MAANDEKETTNLNKRKSEVYETVDDLKRIAHNSSTFDLHRWRAYRIEVTAEDKITQDRGQAAFDHDTFQWQCGDSNRTTISQNQFCNGRADCPNEKDEDPKICKASDISKKISFFIFYPLMVLLITLYFLQQKIQNDALRKKMSKLVKADSNMIDKEKKGQLSFKEHYKTVHSDESSMMDMVETLKYRMNQQMSEQEKAEVFGWVREAEVELHANPAERYGCILAHYGGHSPLAARIAQPGGGLGVWLKRKTNFGVAWMFAMLCFNMFDHIKDIGKFLNYIS